MDELKRPLQSNWHWSIWKVQTNVLFFSLPLHWFRLVCLAGFAACLSDYLPPFLCAYVFLCLPMSVACSVVTAALYSSGTTEWRPDKPDWFHYSLPSIWNPHKSEQSKEIQLYDHMSLSVYFHAGRYIYVQYICIQYIYAQYLYNIYKYIFIYMASWVLLSCDWTMVTLWGVEQNIKQEGSGIPGSGSRTLPPDINPLDITPLLLPPRHYPLGYYPPGHYPPDISPRHVSVYVCNVCIHICMCVYTYVYMYACMYACIHVCIYVYTYICMYVHTYVFMYVCMHACMHTYIHT